MKQIVLAVGLAAVFAVPAHADWRYLILNEPLDQPVREKRAEPVLPPNRGDHRVDAVLDIVMNGGVRGQAEVVVTADNQILVSGEGARLAGLGFGPGDEIPSRGFFYPVEHLRPAVRAQVSSSQLLLQTGVDTALQRTPGISRAQTRPNVAPISGQAPGFDTQPLAAPAVPAPAARALPSPETALALDPSLQSQPVQPVVPHQLPWPDALNAPIPRSREARTIRQAEVMVSVDGEARGVVIAALAANGRPQIAPEDLQAMRLPVPAAAVDRGYALPEDLSQTYTTQYDAAALELRLSTRSPDRWFLAEDATDDRDCTPSGPRRGAAGARGRDC